MRRLLWSLLALIIVLAVGAGGVLIAAKPIATRIAEDRLADATGRRWTVSFDPSIEFGATPVVVLRNLSARVALDGDTARVEARSVRLSGSLGDWTDRRRLPLVEVEAPTVEVPSQWWRFAEMPAGAKQPDLTVDRVTARGGTLLVRSDSAARAAASEVDLDVTRGTNDGRVTLKAEGRFGGEALRAEIGLGAASQGGGYPVIFTLRTPRLPENPIIGAGNAGLDGSLFVLSRLAGTFGGNRFSGNLLVDVSGKPKVRVDLALPTLTLPRVAEDGAPGGGPGLTIAPADFALLKEFDGTLKLTAGTLEVPSPKMTVKDVAAEVTVADGALRAATTRTGIYGGQLAANLALQNVDGVLRQTVQTEIVGARGMPLLANDAGAAVLDGAGSGRVVLQSRGWNWSEMSASLTGGAEIDLREGRITAANLPPRLRSAVAQLPAITQRADAATTAFDRVVARIQVQDGRATINELSLQSPVLTASVAGTVDLKAKNLALRIGGNRLGGTVTADFAARTTVRAEFTLPVVSLPKIDTGDSAGWRIEPADFARLKDFDASLRVTAEGIDLPSPALPLRNVVADVAVANGALTVALPRAVLYDGQGTATLQLWNPDGLLRQTFQGQITGVRGLPLLGALVGFTMLDGTASTRFGLQAQGWSSADVTRSVAGTAEVDVANGRLNSIDLPSLPKMMAAQLPSLTQRKDAETTAFDRVSARFEVQGGRAVTNDFALTSPLVTAKGAGTIDFVSQTLSFRFNTQAVARGGIVAGMDIAVPVVVEGPFSNPRATPDFKGATSGGRPVPGLDALGGLLGGMLGGGAGGILGGGNNRAPQGAPPNQAPPQQGYGYNPQPNPGYAPPQGQGYAPPQNQGYAPPQGQGYAAPQGQGYAPAPNQGYGAPPAYGQPQQPSGQQQQPYQQQPQQGFAQQPGQQPQNLQDIGQGLGQLLQGFMGGGSGGTPGGQPSRP